MPPLLPSHDKPSMPRRVGPNEQPSRHAQEQTQSAPDRPKPVPGNSVKNLKGAKGEGF